MVTGTVSRRQGHYREVMSEGSPRQNPEPTNRNQIEGQRGGVIRHWTEKPGSHSDTRAGKSGSDREKDEHLTLGDLNRVRR